MKKEGSLEENHDPSSAHEQSIPESDVVLVVTPLFLSFCDAFESGGQFVPEGKGRMNETNSNYKQS